MSIPNIVVDAAIPSKSAISSAAQQAHVDTFNHLSFVWHIDIFLLAFAAVFFLISLPRAFVRFSHRREWWDGHFLRYVDIDHIIRTRPKSVPRLRIPSMALISPTSGTWLNSEKEADLQRNGSQSSQAHLMRNNTTASDRRRRAMMDLPVHMANWTTRLPILSSLTRIPIRPGLTVGGASILVAYFTLMAYGGLYKSNLLTDPLRTGYLAVSQIPVVIILATKNNVLGMLLGAAYTRVSAVAFHSILFRGIQKRREFILAFHVAFVFSIPVPGAAGFHIRLIAAVRCAHARLFLYNFHGWRYTGADMFVCS